MVPPRTGRVIVVDRSPVECCGSRSCPRLSPTNFNSPNPSAALRSAETTTVARSTPGGPAAVLAELATFIPERQRPVGAGATFSGATFSAAAGATETRRVSTDDAATVLLRYPNGAKGVMSTSQISHGRKNALQWEIAGDAASAAWHSETPDQLWIGHRDAPNQILQRDAGLMNASGAAATSLPGGHVEGFADSFHALFRQVYGDVAKGGRSADATYASFDDGHHEMLVCDAVLQSAKDGRWIAVASD